MNKQINHQPNTRQLWLISRLFYRNVALLGLTTILINPVAASYAQPSPILSTQTDNYLVQITSDDYYKQGIEKLQRGDYQGAIDAFNQAILLNSKNVNAYISRGNAYVELGNSQLLPKTITEGNYQTVIRDYNEAPGENYQKAISDYDEALKLDPSNADAYNNRGVCRQALGDFQGAIQDFYEVIRLQPNSILPYLNLGNVFYKQGNYTAARQNFRTAEKIFQEQGQNSLLQEFVNRLTIAVENYDNPNPFLQRPSVETLATSDVETLATSVKWYISDKITFPEYPLALADNQSILQFSAELVLKHGYFSTTTLKPLADFGLGSIPIGKNTPAQQVAPLVWLILLLGEGSGLVQVPLSISVIANARETIELLEAFNKGDFLLTTLHGTSLAADLKGYKRLSAILGILAEFSGEYYELLRGSDPPLSDSTPTPPPTSTPPPPPTFTPPPSSTHPPSTPPKPVIIVTNDTGANTGYNLDKKSEQLLLEGKWQQLKTHLQNDLHPVAALLTGHAKLATNDNNASLLSFIAASKNPEILKQWEKWTENFLKQHQNSPIALYLAGDAKARLGKIEEAIAYFDKAIALDGNFALAYNARGVLYALKEDRNKAYFDLLQATDKDRNLADAYVNLGTLAVLQESSINLGSGALDAFGKALAINPEFALAYNNRGSLYLGNNEVEKARSDFSQVQTFPLIADLFLQNQKLADARKPSDPRDSLDGQQAPGGIISNPGESSIDRGDWKVKTCFGLFYQVSIVRETTN